MTESEHQPSRLEAISTRWTLFRRAHQGSIASAGDARDALVLRYSPAVCRYVGAMIRNDQDADDVSQDVVLRLLAGDFAGADPQRGRFRDFLKTAIRNMVRNFWSRQKRRRPVDVDVGRLESEQDDPDEGPWLAAWRRSVLDLAWKALEQHQRSRAGSVCYTLLRLRTDHPDDTSEQLAARLSEQAGKPFRAAAVRQQLHRARSRFAELLVDEVANGLDGPTPQRTEDELIALGLWELVRDFLPGS